MKRDERPLDDVPRYLKYLGGCVLLSLWLINQYPPAEQQFLDKPSLPPDDRLVQLLTPSEPHWSSRLMVLALQDQEIDRGVRIPLHKLNYEHLVAWLDLILKLDADNRFPPLIAAHYYAEVADTERVRVMLDFVHTRFIQDPKQHWPWMVSAVIKAKHRVKDLSLADRLATDLAQYTSAIDVPSWVRQMHIFVKADAGEVEEARALLGALLESGEIASQEEFTFLAERLRQLDVME